MKTPEGVEVRNNSIRICFTYKEVRCRETLKGWTVTKGNIKKASNLRSLILSEISVNEFNYLERFPQSRKAQQLSSAEQKASAITLGQLIDQFIELKSLTLSSQTLETLIRHFDICKKHLDTSTLISSFTYADALIYLKALKSTISNRGTLRTPRYINKHIHLLNQCFELAIRAGYLKANPFSNIERLKSDSTEPDPLEMEEFNALINAPINPQFKNMITVAVYTGLRSGELCALAWEDIDLEKGTLRVSRNITAQRKFTTPKNKKSTRTVFLLKPAIEALMKQREFTYLKRPQEILVEQKGSTELRKDKIRFVFTPASKTYGYYLGAVYSVAWNRTLKKVGIKHRRAYQTRHTYACWMITKGANLSFIAEQMGHRGTSMLEQVYGKWMESHSHEQITMLNQKIS